MDREDMVCIHTHTHTHTHTHIRMMEYYSAKKINDNVICSNTDATRESY